MEFLRNFLEFGETLRFVFLALNPIFINFSDFKFTKYNIM